MMLNLICGTAFSFADKRSIAWASAQAFAWAGKEISENALTFFDFVSFTAGVASFVLSLLAIWLSLHFKRESDRVNEHTQKILREIMSESKAITLFFRSERSPSTSPDEEVVRGKLPSDSDSKRSAARMKRAKGQGAQPACRARKALAQAADKS